MPNPQEVAELSVNGSVYRDWDSVTVQKAFGAEYTIMTFSAASPAETNGWGKQRLKIGDKCQCRLAGVQVADGLIFTRQVAFDAKRHGLQVQVSSKPALLTHASVEQSRGFKGSNLEQIGNALTKPFGIKFKVEGNLAGADKVFERFHVQPGETVTNAIRRLCKMRNLFLVDNEKGELTARRMDGGKAAQAHLEEGRNIKSASLVATQENIHNQITVLGQQPGTDSHWGDQARDTSAKVINPEVKEHKPLIIRAPEPADREDAKMFGNYVAAAEIATMLTAEITVQGWHAPGGKLWIQLVGENVTVKSPMLFPQISMMLAVQAVTHRQANGSGTETILSLIIPDRLGGGGKIQADADPAATKTSAAVPTSSDV